MTTISAGTTSTTAYVATPDTTGALVLKTGSGNTTALTLDSSQNATLAGALTVSGTLTAGTVSGAGTGLTGTASSLNAGIGVGQTWSDVTASRAFGTTYTNSTSKPIQVSICANNSTASHLNLSVSGVTTAKIVLAAGNTGGAAQSIIPVGATYVATVTAGTASNVSWSELR